MFSYIRNHWAGLAASLVMAVLWHILAMGLLSEGGTISANAKHTFDPHWIGAAIVAGMVAGVMTLYLLTKLKRGCGWYGLAIAPFVYFAAMITYWLIVLCLPGSVPSGRFSEAVVLMIFTLLGIVMWSGLFVPLCWLTQAFVWNVHLRLDKPALR